MKRNHVALIQNLETFLTSCTSQELYLIARGLAGELDGRVHHARLEAYALTCALLPDAQREHAAIFSEDCTCGATHALPHLHHAATCGARGNS